MGQDKVTVCLEIWRRDRSCNRAILLLQQHTVVAVQGSLVRSVHLPQLSTALDLGHAVVLLWASCDGRRQANINGKLVTLTQQCLRAPQRERLKSHWCLIIAPELEPTKDAIGSRRDKATGQASVKLLYLGKESDHMAYHFLDTVLDCNHCCDWRQKIRNLAAKLQHVWLWPLEQSVRLPDSSRRCNDDVHQLRVHLVHDVFHLHFLAEEHSWWVQHQHGDKGHDDDSFLHWLLVHSATFVCVQFSLCRAGFHPVHLAGLVLADFVCDGDSTDYEEL